MSEDKKSLIDLVPGSVDNAIKNITDKPTQNMGTTLADIWYLVFGGISQAAEKRKLKYSYAIQEFEKELKEKISKIPEDKLTEPDTQVIAPALEASKYCVEKEELRHMFSSLIASSMTQDNYIPPMIINIISSLSPIDCKILKFLYSREKHRTKLIDLFNASIHTNQEIINIALIELEQMSLVESRDYSMSYDFINFKMYEYRSPIILTTLGRLLCTLCLDTPE